MIKLPLSLLLVGCLMTVVGCIDFKEREFIKRELSGILVELEDVEHGRYLLHIRENKTKDTVRYSLFFKEFREEHDIRVNDSISKLANGHEIYFYKKKNGKYYKTSELYYY